MHILQAIMLYSQDKKLKYSSSQKPVGIFEEKYLICCF